MHLNKVYWNFILSKVSTNKEVSNLVTEMLTLKLMEQLLTKVIIPI